MSRLRSDKLLLATTVLAGAITVAIVLLVFGFLFVESAPAFRELGLLRFLTDRSWQPAVGAQQGQFSILPMLAGSFAVMAGAVMLAAPTGIVLAVFGRFYAPARLAKAYRSLNELLAGVPSVVYGLWGLVVVVPLLGQWRAPGQSLLAGALILGFMILPTVVLLTDSALRSLPRSYLQGAAALALPRGATVWGVVLPAIRGGIATAVLLAVTRALGETMAVLMVTGNVVQWPESVTRPMRTITANIVLELGYALDVHRSTLFVSGLVLMVGTVTLVGLMHWFGKDYAVE